MVWTVASGLRCDPDRVIWHMPLAQVLQFVHCHLAAHGADVVPSHAGPAPEELRGRLDLLFQEG